MVAARSRQERTMQDSTPADVEDVEEIEAGTANTEHLVAMEAQHLFLQTWASAWASAWVAPFAPFPPSHLVHPTCVSW